MDERKYASRTYSASHLFPSSVPAIPGAPNLIPSLESGSISRLQSSAALAGVMPLPPTELGMSGSLYPRTELNNQLAHATRREGVKVSDSLDDISLSSQPTDILHKVVLIVTPQHRHEHWLIFLARTGPLCWNGLRRLDLIVVVPLQVDSVR